MSQKSSNAFARASIATADNLRTIAENTVMQHDNQQLSLPEVDEAVDLIARMVPAGNVPGIILSGLSRLTGRRAAAQTAKRDVSLLLQSVEKMLDQAVYGSLFAGPAAVIWGYQHLLKLAGKTPEDAFPEGTWQFYVDYALREDTARHTNETHGFDTLLNAHNIKLKPIDRTTAWVMTAIDILHQYPALLQNEWRERVHTHTVNIVSDGRFPGIYRTWEQQRPYGRRADAGTLTYSEYRKLKFDRFLAGSLLSLSSQELDRWQTITQKLEQENLAEYQQQMTICSCLTPDAHSETRTPLQPGETYIGVIYRGGYYLIPTCEAESNKPADVFTVRSQVAAIINGVIKADDAHLKRLAICKRSAIASLPGQLNPQAQSALQKLRHTPILINLDTAPQAQSLTAIRHAERGIGDHALTIFDTGSSFIFDQSHIYFDGAWGAALAEILTNEALSWARFMASLPPTVAQSNGIQPLRFHWQSADLNAIGRMPRVSTECSAESDRVNINGMLGLRKLFKQRSDLLKLTINDLLVLYRAIHAVTYQPSPDLIEDLTAASQNPRSAVAAKVAIEAINNRDNPAIIIPIDASLTSPSERLYPMNITVPLFELNLVELHRQAYANLEAYKNGSGDRTAIYQAFDQQQREYLAMIAAFGQVMRHAKEIALSGESVSSGTIRLLAHIPRPLQRLLDGIPARFDVINDIIKGREVFSNIGRVVPSSTLKRFNTAKDDNEKKTLVWGIITDAQSTMHISLRDFRPHVNLLHEVGMDTLAQRITQDYLDNYVNGLNQYITDLRRITIASRETRVTLEPGYDD